MASILLFCNIMGAQFSKLQLLSDLMGCSKFKFDAIRGDQKVRINNDKSHYQKQVHSFYFSPQIITFVPQKYLFSTQKVPPCGALAVIYTRNGAGHQFKYLWRSQSTVIPLLDMIFCVCLYLLTYSSFLPFSVEWKTVKN